jgi:predicted nucleic acid-binding protein
MPQADPTDTCKHASDVAIPIVVLDTNVLLDAVVFRSPVMSPWHDALCSGHIRAMASAETWAEWQHVLTRSFGPRWDELRERALTSGPDFEIHRWADAIPAPPFGLRCSDIDDQKFIDLALASGARWLLTRDHALLRLDRAARRFGLAVLRPADAAPD